MTGTLTRNAKAFAALGLSILGGLAVAGAGDGQVVRAEAWATLGVAVATARAVWRIPNVDTTAAAVLEDDQAPPW